MKKYSWRKHNDCDKVAGNQENISWTKETIFFESKWVYDHKCKVHYLSFFHLKLSKNIICCPNLSFVFLVMKKFIGSGETPTLNVSLAQRFPSGDTEIPSKSSFWLISLPECISLGFQDVFGWQFPVVLILNLEYLNNVSINLRDGDLTCRCSYLTQVDILFSRIEGNYTAISVFWDKENTYLMFYINKRIICWNFIHRDP